MDHSAFSPGRTKQFLNRILHESHLVQFKGLLDRLLDLLRAIMEQPDSDQTEWTSCRALCRLFLVEFSLDGRFLLAEVLQRLVDLARQEKENSALFREIQALLDEMAARKGDSYSEAVVQIIHLNAPIYLQRPAFERYKKSFSKVPKFEVDKSIWDVFAENLILLTMLKHLALRPKFLFKVIRIVQSLMVSSIQFWNLPAAHYVDRTNRKLEVRITRVVLRTLAEANFTPDIFQDLFMSEIYLKFNPDNLSELLQECWEHTYKISISIEAILRDSKAVPATKNNIITFNRIVADNINIIKDDLPLVYPSMK